MLTQFFSQLGFMAYFGLNRQTIAIEKCENKNKPASCCLGKCYLGKQLSGMQQEQSSNKPANENEIQLYMLPETVVLSNRSCEFEPYFPDFYMDLLKGYVDETEHPPYI
jgi:hypothetical protein